MGYLMPTFDSFVNIVMITINVFLHLKKISIYLKSFICILMISTIPISYKLFAYS